MGLRKGWILAWMRGWSEVYNKKLEREYKRVVKMKNLWLDNENYFDVIGLAATLGYRLNEGSVNSNIII